MMQIVTVFKEFANLFLEEEYTMNLIESYMTGISLGYAFTGALLGGIIPFIIFAIKKHWVLAALSLLGCGLAAFIHPIASLVVGVLFLIASIRVYDNRN